MRRADAPPAGWYPAPEGGNRLRWWDGEDWSDRWRARPSKIAPSGSASLPPDLAASGRQFLDQARAPLASVDRAQIVEEVRRAARAEVDRAADLFSIRARDATRRIEPLISEATNRFFKLAKRIAAIAFAVFVVYLIVQAVGQASLLDWLGDRIDSFND